MEWTYSYPKPEAVDLDILDSTIRNSILIEKDLYYLRWDQDKSELLIVFKNQLTIEDISLLNTIVEG